VEKTHRLQTTYERLVRNAIAGRWLVEVREAGSASWRQVAPHAMFRTALGAIGISCFEPAGTGAASLGDREEVLEIGQIAGLRLIDEQFEPNPQVDRSSAVYEAGVICSV
jgi:hypothetical protein